MTKAIAKINAQIKKLEEQRRRQTLHRHTNEIKNIVQTMREYGLSPQDLLPALAGEHRKKKDPAQSLLRKPAAPSKRSIATQKQEKQGADGEGRRGGWWGQRVLEQIAVSFDLTQSRKDMKLSSEDSGPLWLLILILIIGLTVLLVTTLFQERYEISCLAGALISVLLVVRPLVMSGDADSNGTDDQ